MLNHIPALASAFLGGVLLYLSIYLPIQSIIFPTILAGAGTMALAYSYGLIPSSPARRSRCWAMYAKICPANSVDHP